MTQRVRQAPKGFSLVELLLSLGMSAVVLTIALAAFVDFVKVERRHRELGAEERNARSLQQSLEADAQLAGVGLSSGESALGLRPQPFVVVDGGVELMGPFPERGATRARVAWWLEAEPLDRECTELGEGACHSYALGIRVPGLDVASAIEACDDESCRWGAVTLDEQIVVVSEGRPLGAEAHLVRAEPPRVDDARRVWVVVESPVELGRPSPGATVSTPSRVLYRLEGTTLTRRTCGWSGLLERPGVDELCSAPEPVARGIEALSFAVVDLDDGVALTWRATMSSRVTEGAARAGGGTP